MSTKYLDPRLRYYNFRFLKTNGRHIEILLPVSILLLHPHRPVILRQPTKFHLHWTNRGSYDVIAIFKMAAVSCVVFASKCN